MPAGGIDDLNARLMPTPEEIAAATAEIRAGWTEAERQRRDVLTDYGPVQPPLCEVVLRPDRTIKD